jgi:hypothetical protein
MANDYQLIPTTPPDAGYQLQPINPAELAPAPETLAPKGQLPRQLNVREQQQWAQFDAIAKRQKMMQDALATEQATATTRNPEEPWPIGPIVEGAKPFAEAAARDIGDVFAGTPSYLLNKMNAVPRTIGNVISPGLGNRIAPEIYQPTFNDVLTPLAAAKTGMSLSDARAALNTQQKAIEQLNPGATVAGKIAGDVATIAAPTALKAEGVVGMTLSPDERRALAFSSGAGTGSMEQLRAMWNQPGAQLIRRGLGKVGETGLEQYFLSDVHQQNHPLINGALAAGLQLGGNVAMWPLAMFPKTSAALTALIGGTVATTMYNDWIPGGKTSFMGNLNDTIKAMSWGTAGAMTAALFGGGRLRGAGEPFGAGAVVGGTRPAYFHHEVARRIPEIAETVNSTLRTITRSSGKSWVTRSLQIRWSCRRCRLWLRTQRTLRLENSTCSAMAF